MPTVVAMGEGSSYFILRLLHTLCHNINPVCIRVYVSYLLQSRILELKEPQYYIYQA